MSEFQGFKKPGSYGKVDAAQRLVSEWATSRGLVNLDAPFVVFGPKGAKATFAFVEGGPRRDERIHLATQAERLPFHIVSADSFDGRWGWRRLVTGERYEGTRQDFQRYVCKLSNIPSDLKGIISPAMREELLANKRTWTDLAIREIGHVGKANKTDLDCLVTDPTFKHSIMLVEGQHENKGRPWTVTRSCALEMGIKSCCIEYNDLGQFSIETKPFAGFSPWVSATEMKDKLNHI
jgi:hypothetical protein